MGIYNLGGGGGAPELQAKEATPLITNAQQIILPDEGYDGLSKVTVNPMPTGTLKTPTVNSIGYVSSGVQTAGYFDTSATSGLQLSTQAAKTITPTTYSQTAVASGKYTTGNVTVAGDANLVPENIIAGKSIFGTVGTYKPAATVQYQFVKSTGSNLLEIPCNFSLFKTGLYSISVYAVVTYGEAMPAAISQVNGYSSLMQSMPSLYPDIVGLSPYFLAVFNAGYIYTNNVAITLLSNSINFNTVDGLNFDTAYYYRAILVGV